MHIPVLLDEVIHYLDPRPGKFIIDGAVDGGGHAEEIIKRIQPNGTFLGIDLDNEMIMKTAKRLMTNPSMGLMAGNRRLTTKFMPGNYADLPDILNGEELGCADGLLLDLGFSTEQLEAGKGFSFNKDEVLDMRYDSRISADRNADQRGLESDISVNQRGNPRESAVRTAAEVINSLPEQELANIFWTYGEERYGRRIAKEIVITRKKKRIIRTTELVAVIEKVVPRGYEHGRIHPATRVFQGLRIYVNHEMENLDTALRKLPRIMASHGRVVLISFHSLEDRRVKQAFRELEKRGKARILTKKPIRASKEEIERNPRSRGAKLRAIEIQ
ncbi:16S rRNA (cytosine(1402)-N(4))-methyltransferase RsmH [Candidatus Wolfebacteria bacterium]|nr:16S rRNA (cytosine(1402)-N(4))-methyltransferase RsmH [Candidatus Wolfebacteria bacterium]